MIPVPFFTLTLTLSPQGRGKSRYGSSQVYSVLFRPNPLVPNLCKGDESGILFSILHSGTQTLRHFLHCREAARSLANVVRHIPLEPAVHEGAG
jgi:hypothetical protein